MLYVIGRAPNRGRSTMWHCVCKCGNETDVAGDKLRSGHTKSCGCLKHHPAVNRIDLTGQRFGRLVVQSMDWGTKVTKCNCICDCGNSVSVAYSCLRQGITRSCGCYKKEHAGEQNRTDLTGMHIGYLTAIERIPGTGCHTRYRCVCDCGNETVVDGPCWLNGSVRSCGCKRSKSVGEETIETFLNDRHIDYYPQYRFDDCKYKRTLPFDFFLPDYNVCIEYQGIQHYEPVEWFYDTENTFEERQKRDQIKREYCKDNGILLIEIPYFYNNEKIKNTIINTLNP